MPANEWCLAAYTEDGERLGFSTTISSLVQLSRKAERFTDREAALRRVDALDHAWRGHSIWWVVEKYIPDVDIREDNASVEVDSARPYAVPSSARQSKRGRTMKPKQPKPKLVPKPAKPATTPAKLLPSKPVMRTTARAAKRPRRR